LSPMMIRASEPPMTYLRRRRSGVFNMPGSIGHHLVYNCPISSFSPIWVKLTHKGESVKQAFNWCPNQVRTRTSEMECARIGPAFILGREYNQTSRVYRSCDFTHGRQ
jgi:hypothetical protein